MNLSFWRTAKQARPKSRIDSLMHLHPKRQPSFNYGSKNGLRIRHATSLSHTPALLPHFITQSDTFVEHNQITTESASFRNIIDGMKTYIGYCQKRLTDAEGYDAEAEALIHGLHDEFSGLHSSQSEFFMLDMFLDSHVFDWAFAYNNKQIYKVNSDGTRGDLLLDIGGQEGIEANAGGIGISRIRYNAFHTGIEGRYSATA